MTLALEVRNLRKTFGGGRTLTGRPRPEIHAVRDVSLSARKGETLGIVGESGCGKSTLARMLVGLLKQTKGEIVIEGKNLSDQVGDPAAFGRLIQYVFQDPISSLNPRKTIREILEAPLIHLLGMDESARKARITELFDAVNLRDEFLTRYPHEFSGGQAQRIGIARALAASPRILVLDEPVSALDVSVQAQVLNLLADLRKAMDLTYLFISHDLAVVEAVSDSVAVLYFGRVVEVGRAESIFSAPRHPYTSLLARSAPIVGRDLARTESLAVELPDPLRPPSGCAFAARCPSATMVCRDKAPAIEAFSQDHEAACHHPL
ncbi:ATP-binding cassette domain-containing protein [Pelagibius litoralis]|uniref:ATP-binding cassette domain-containing protein n=1 Tax=Pelagibius litoralis TaxID=374515 RepID=A0A967F3V6_9PROT|nr:oligopeptide/dipeptide ABC transporter ATP-binding protein [Pelagibius litoralis]NIA72499.1 ATP-binding cassette domain-containing protein [Pelagibius litoralis]